MLISKLKEDFNGCPLFEKRAQGDMETMVGKTITIEDYFKLSDYHVVIFEEDKEHFYFSGGTLKNMLEKYGEQDMRGVQVIPKPKIKTASRRDFRPFEVV